MSVCLLAVALLGGEVAPAAYVASRGSAMHEGPLGYLPTEQQPGNIIDQGLDRHLKLISLSDILDDPTNNEESAEVYPTLQRIGRQEGFTVKVVTASPTVWIRDDFLALSNGTWLAPSSDADVMITRSLPSPGTFRPSASAGRCEIDTIPTSRAPLERAWPRSWRRVRQVRSANSIAASSAFGNACSQV